MVDTLPEQVSIAKGEGKRYATYLIPDVDDPGNMNDQVDEWYTWPGVADAPMVSDIEKPRWSTRVVTPSEFRMFQLRMKARSAFQTWTYSRVNIFEPMFPQGFPSWMSDVLQWIAQYYIDLSGHMYEYFDDWLRIWAWQLPRAVQQSFLYASATFRNMVKAWQISSKFDGEFYLAPEWISPGQPGIKSIDGNVSIEPLAQFLSYFPDDGTPPPIEPPPIDPVAGDQYLTLVEGQNMRTEPSTSGGSATVIKKLPRGALLTASPCETVGKDYTGITTFIPGLDRPKDIWVHVQDADGVRGWVAAYHPSRSSVYIQSTG